MNDGYSSSATICAYTATQRMLTTDNLGGDIGMTMHVPARWTQRYRSPQERRRHRVFVTMATSVIVA